MTYKTDRNIIFTGECLQILQTLPDESINCCITSPPYYGLRNYGIPGQIGLEETIDEYLSNIVAVSTEIRRVLKKDGTYWIVLGDSYWRGKGRNGSRGSADQEARNKSGKSLNKGHQMIDGYKDKIKPTDGKHPVLKPKDIIGIPWRVAFALQESGWYLRQDIIWNKPNPMPESVKDRCTKAHEYIFLLSKNKKYYFNSKAIQELAKSNKPKAMKNRRSVWTIPTQPTKYAHFATFPENIVIPMIEAGCPTNGVVLDPFMGAGTVAVVAKKLNRNYIGIELNPDYVSIANKRIESTNKPLSML